MGALDMAMEGAIQMDRDMAIGTLHLLRFLLFRGFLSSEITLIGPAFQMLGMLAEETRNPTN
jgi:hypothetical protein